MGYMFTNEDLDLISSLGIGLDKVNVQLDNFRKGFPFLPIDRAAVIGDGIWQLSPAEAMCLSERYDAVCREGRLKCIKFVPASGAATRMFKDLYEFLSSGNMNPATGQVLENIEKFAFYDDLKKLGVDFSDPRAVIGSILGEGLSYGTEPKGLIKFHKYPDTGRTPLEEHLVEGALYAAVAGNPVRIHFTVSPEHIEGFKKLAERRSAEYGNKYGVKYEVTYSVQKSSTDTIAVDMRNEPLRDSDGKLLFRPAGHGALLDNLDELDPDLIFIKTVDNVVTDRLKGDTTLYKKALAAKALELQEQIFGHIRAIDDGSDDPSEIIAFIENSLGCRLPGTSSFESLRTILDRPLRVCGMVRNEGEPGGGPFWVRDAAGGQSLQIAESSQISPAQKDLMQKATHFNPVDLVCAVRDHKGDKFNLERYVDPLTGFISIKSKDGRELKAQELPGLWNGAMAHWNTVFMEVPISTFAPVKSVSDLLREQHT